MDKSKIDKIYPLSSMQEGMLFHSLLSQEEATYFEQVILKLNGQVDPLVFEQSVKVVIDRYDIFRTVFLHLKVQRPRQVVLKERPFQLYVEDLTHLVEKEQQQYLEQYIERDKQKGFELSKDVLMRFALFQIGQSDFQLIWSYHHILMDGWCTSIVLGELFHIYQCLHAGKPILLAPPTSYGTFIKWLEQQDNDAATDYWNMYLQHYELTAEVPLKQQNGGNASANPDVKYENAQVLLTIDESLTHSFMELAKQLQVTANCLFQTLWGILLQRYNNTDDVVFGAVVSGRPAAIQGIETMVGLFINTIPVRIQTEAGQTVSALVQRVQEAAIQSEQYSYVSLADIQAKSQLSRNLFQHIVTYQNFGMASMNTLSDKGELPFTIGDVSTYEQSNYDFNIMVAPHAQLGLKFMFNAAVYDAALPYRLVEHFTCMLNQVVQNPEIAVEQLTISSDAETQWLLTELTETKSIYGKEKTLQQHFAEQVERTPDRTAIVFEGQTLTYRELNEQANRAARVLRAQGVGPNVIVAVLCDRSVEMIVALLAILKAGGAYLPIDPDNPLERIRYMLEDSGAAWLVTRSHLIAAAEVAAKAAAEVVAKAVLEATPEARPEAASGATKHDTYAAIPILQQFKGKLIVIEEAMSDAQRFDEQMKDCCDVAVDSSSDDLAYVIYTSGSTGKPKGTLVKHYNVSRVVKATNYIQIDEKDNVLQLSNYAFDGSTFDIYGALLNGATLVLLKREDVTDIGKLAGTIREQGITVFFITTALFNVLIDLDASCLKNVRKVLFGGENVSVSHVRQALEVVGEDVLTHVYGPTESTVFATAYSIREVEEGAATVPIGRPLANTEAYVMDSKMRMQPRGIPGELCLGGDGLAAGYLNQHELTAEKFVAHPYVSGEKLYRTGDLVRVSEDGQIEYIGRIDQQVKIRGFRIEPDEIAVQLREHPAIQEAVVVAIQGGTGESHYLCAYYVPNQPIEVAELRTHIAAILPQYMVPTYYVELNRIPLTPNGKIDKKALPQPNSSEHFAAALYVPPENETEADLLLIWEDVLGSTGIGTSDSFFERGGHSLKAIMLMSRIQKQFHVDIPLRLILQHPTIKSMASLILNGTEQEQDVIAAASPMEYYPASSAQKRMYMVSQFQEVGTSYNIPYLTHIRGPLDIERLRQAVSKLTDRHESLRTSFMLLNNEIVQQIHDQVDVPFTVILCTREEVASYSSTFIRPFVLQQAPLLRVELLQLAEEEFVLMIDVHHIVSDGISSQILIRELQQLYDTKSLPQLRIQYKDYAVWQLQQAQSDTMKKHEDYWLAQFHGEVPVLELPTDFPRSAVKQYEGNRHVFRVDRQIVDQLSQVCHKQQSTLYMILLAAYHVFLSRYSGQDDIVIGSPIAGRSHVDLEPIVGMFVNTLAIRNTCSSEQTFINFLTDVKETVLRAFEHEQYPLEEVINKLDLQRDSSRNPLFDTMFALQNMQLAQNESSELVFQPYPFNLEISKFDLMFVALQQEDGLYVEIEYRTSLFKAETIERMGKHFARLLTEIAIHPERLIGQLSMISEDEEMLFDKVNATDISSTQLTLAQIFEMQVESAPEKIALTIGERDVSYQTLNKRANQIAHFLRANQVGANARVALMLSRSTDMIAAIFGVMKAGGAYVPIDPDYPADRVNYMLHDSQALLLLTDQEIGDTVQFEGEIKQLQQIELSDFPSSNMVANCSPSDLAYVMYTSGSTGRPKGTLTTHQNIIRVVKNTNYIQIQPDDRLLQLSNYAFDGSTFDIFGALLNCARLVLVSKDTMLDIDALTELIQREQITVFFITTALFNTLVDVNVGALQRVRKILFGGEKVSIRHVRSAYSILGPGKLVHMYGPTESTVYATFYPILQVEANAHTVPIGRPLANTQVYVLDRHDRLQMIGVPGELCISGQGLCEGYLNNAEMTAEKFVEHPFLPHERLYRTGDLVKMLPDGNLEYISRMDNQVKLRGYRIELGEITRQLLAIEEVESAFVVARTDNQGQGYLCAYVVMDDERDESFLRESLSELLPSYMMPAYFVIVPEMPLTPNGKIDQRALPQPDVGDVFTVEYVKPETAVERRLAEIWASILGVNKVGLNDNFFKLGGHSLKASVLVSRIRLEMQATVTLSDLFQRPTVRELAALLAIQPKSVVDEYILKAIDDRLYYPTSSAQKRMYYVSQLDSEGITYNMPLIVRLPSNVNMDRLIQSLHWLVERHESLRTSFNMIEGELVQQIHQNVSFVVTSATIRAEEVAGRKQAFVRAFDLHRAPLLRAELLHVENESFILLLDMHHIVSDGVSISIFVNELNELYKGQALPPLTIHYKDYVVWKQSQKNHKNWLDAERYWLNRFTDDVPVLQLPTDYARPAIQKFGGSRHSIVLNRDSGLRIHDLCKEWGMTTYTLLLAAYAVFLHKYTEREDVIIGSPVTGRNHPDIDGTLGMFVNMLPLRVFPHKTRTFAELAEEVKQIVVDAYPHQDYPLEDMIEQLGVRRDMSRNPLFDTVFTYQPFEANRGMNGFAEPSLLVEDTEHGLSKFDLTVSVTEQEYAHLCVEMEYSTHLFKHSTVERMAGHFVHVLEQIVAKPNERLSELHVLTASEEKQLLDVFNDTFVAHPVDCTIHELFERQVALTPDHPAVVLETASDDAEHEVEKAGRGKAEHVQLTYRELNERANQLASILRHKGAGIHTVVGIMMERSLDMLVGVLGILKAGAAYMPIDPAYPQERIEYMLQDSGTSLVVTHREGMKSTTFAGEVVDVDLLSLHTENDTENEQEITLNRTSVEASHSAYIIYTSGSTGKPKGVAVAHRSLVNLSCWHNRHFSVTALDRSTKFAGFGFDASVWEVFPYLIAGATLFIVPDEARTDVQRLNAFMERNGITISFLPTPICEPFMELDNSSLRLLLTGGEKLKTYRKQSYQLVNNYGPTENTVVATSYSVQEAETNLPIGKPIDNVRVYIVSKDGKLQPIGIPGELCLAGEGLAQGYLHQPEMTAQKFEANPYEAEGLLYRTGDLARWREDGNIEYLGRIDSQVKVRGFRVELGEITQRLIQHEAVKEAVVLGKQDSRGHVYLAAYVVGRKEWSVAQLRTWLAQALPDYMVPTYYVGLEALPLTANGKVDERALPEPDNDFVNETPYVAPVTWHEKILAEIWGEVLGVEGLGVHDHFFERGGHSLKVTQVVNRISEQFNVTFPLRLFFERPTIMEQAAYVAQVGNGEKNVKEVLIPIVEEREYYPVTPLQLYTYQSSSDQTIYNMPQVLKVEGLLDMKRLERSFRTIVERHEALRTSFTEIDGVLMMKIDQEVRFELVVEQAWEEDVSNKINDFIRPFDLNSAPLIRAKVIQIEHESYILMVDMHHIISDGISFSIFFNELMMIYQGQSELQPLRIQFKDFVVWSSEQLHSGALEQTEQFWRSQLGKNPPVLQIETDYPRPSIRSFEGDQIRFTLDESLTEQVRNFSLQHDVTLYMTLLAAYYALLMKYSNQEDIIVGTLVAGRPTSELERVMGLFINSLPLRNYPTPDKSYKQFAMEVRTNLLAAYEHQHYPFEALVETLNVPSDPSRSDWYDTAFSFLNMAPVQLQVDGLSFATYPFDWKVAEHDFYLVGVEGEHEIILDFAYCTKLFNKNTILAMANDFRSVVEQVMANSEVKLSELELAMNKIEQGAL
ncbi:non-ribosomal peptide synthetase [Paenibacillus sp. 481]|uniref:non-ribosomal peptide synthetase n=1 Tax=Paenibacillus sp. 481 TaxID=2835869 RepID=UPI001E5EDDA9|nr:non-ribosomal peptide synthetase [Paenibacillus sp. 481]UHA72710.1 amino acid adenylation domain-containing protein [Paenibacillus sp. 481]